MQGRIQVFVRSEAYTIFGALFKKKNIKIKIKN